MGFKTLRRQKKITAVNSTQQQPKYQDAKNGKQKKKTEKNCDDSHLDGHMIFKATGYSFNRLRAHLSIRTYCISLFPFFTSQQQKIGYHFIGRYLKMLPHRNTIIIILWLLLLVLSSFRHNRQAERLTKLHSRWSNG